MYGLGSIEWAAVEFEEVETPTLPKVKINEVLSVICAGEAVTVSEVFSSSRRQRVAKPRQMAYSLARDLTGLSYPSLGRIFRRDHTSLLYGYRVVAARAATDPTFAEKMKAYRDQACALAAERIRNTQPIETPPQQTKSPSLRWATRNKHPRITKNGEWENDDACEAREV